MDATIQTVAMIDEMAKEMIERIEETALHNADEEDLALFIRLVRVSIREAQVKASRRALWRGLLGMPANIYDREAIGVTLSWGLPVRWIVAMSAAGGFGVSCYARALGLGF